MTPEEPAALVHIERTLAESYRREIDQEENIWRSLAFFAAALALQLAALFQIIDKLPDTSTWVGWVAIGLLALAGTSTIVSLGFLAASIYPAKFEYVATDLALLDYAQVLIIREQMPENRSLENPFSAVTTLRGELAYQYAVATDNNRPITKRRERWRSIAGLAVLVAVLATVFLVATTYAHYLSLRVSEDHGHGTPGYIFADTSAPGGKGSYPARHPILGSGSRASSDAGGH